jgi:hypothetical protein
MLSRAQPDTNKRPEFTTLEVTGWQPRNNPLQKKLRPKNLLLKQQPLSQQPRQL